jgi:nucleotide-binding universal stress UspA family protein
MSRPRRKVQLSPIIQGVRGTSKLATTYVHSRVKDLERDHQALKRIERHLARHGLNVRTDHTVPAGDTVTQALLSRAFDMSADLIVAGAYHRSPLREALIGGVGRELLQFMTVPVLMSH